MTAAALKGLWQRKLRALLTAFAVVLGVAMVSGTFVLTDSIERAFDSIFDSSYSKTDAVISGRPIVEGASSGAPTVPERLLVRVRALPGVEAAAGSLADLQSQANTVQLVGRDGSLLASKGAPALGFGFDAREPRFIPLNLRAGSWATGAGQVVIDAGTARSHHYAVGDRIGVVAAGPVERFRIVGIARYGNVDSLGGATLAAFDVPTAQRLLRKHGFDTISLAARAGTSVDELLRQVRPLLSATARVQTASARAGADSKDVSTFIDYLRIALLAFGGIALFVGGFVIFNTLSITVAQRTREFATLRTLGASRGQVLRSVLVETLTIGVLASIVGLVLGLGLARGLSSLFGALGLGLPQAGTVVETRTVVASLTVGTLITVIAGLVPAIRATRIAPINAVREGAAPPPSRLGRRAPIVSAALLLPALGALAYGLLAAGVSVPGRLFAIGLGVAGVFLGVAMVSSRLIGPLAGVLGWPGQRFGGVAGKLARRNAVRNPGRTASAAAALMIGLTLVTTVAVLGEGLRSSATRAVQKQVLASYVVTSANGFDTLPPAVGRAIGGAPGVDATSVRSDKGRAAGASTEVTGVDPAAIARFYRFRYQGAAPRSLAVLDAGGAIVRRTFAEAHHLRVDGRFTLVTPSGARLALRVAGILDQGRFDLDPLLGSVVIGQRAFDASFERASDLYTFVNVPEAYAPVAEQVLREGARRYPGVHVATRDAFVQSRVSGVSQILNLLYVLLGLSVVVSLFGMVNTLVLAVFERTRELGMLRAVGLTQRQARRMVRHESVITALIGAALGLPLGVGLAALVTHALEPYGVELRLPLGTLAAFVAVAVLAGVAAAIIPARRAARLDVLAALGYE